MINGLYYTKGSKTLSLLVAFTRFICSFSQHERINSVTVCELQSWCSAFRNISMKSLAVWDVWKGLNNKCFHATESAIMTNITLAVWSLDTFLISYNNCYHHFTITNPAYSVLLETGVIINSSKVMWHNVQCYNVHSLFENKKNKLD